MLEANYLFKFIYNNEERFIIIDASKHNYSDYGTVRIAIDDYMENHKNYNLTDLLTEICTQNQWNWYDITFMVETIKLN